MYAGDLAKFGLRCPEIMGVVGQLTDAGMLDCLQLLHFHVGSQVKRHTSVSGALTSLCQRMGVNVSGGKNNN